SSPTRPSISRRPARSSDGSACIEEASLPGPASSWPRFPHGLPPPSLDATLSHLCCTTLLPHETNPLDPPLLLRFPARDPLRLRRGRGRRISRRRSPLRRLARLRRRRRGKTALRPHRPPVDRPLGL